MEASPETLPDRQLALPVPRRLEMAYWLYWRAYEMTIPGQGFREVFEEELESVYGRLMGLLRRLGMARRENGCYHLTERSAYWIHRLQNEYALNHINRLWGRCRREAWPGHVRL